MLPRALTWITRISLVLGVIALAVTVGMVGPSVLLTHLETIGAWFMVLGVALAFARRVNQIIFAALGFPVLAADRIADKVELSLPQPQPVTR
jgi:hypothetical protein